MQLFTLAGFIFSLAALTVAAPTSERSGPCAQAKQQAGSEMPGKYVPQCTRAGYYESKQCYPSTGYCWCVDPDTGNELVGTRVGPGRGEPPCPPCHKKRAQALQGPGFVGGYAPVCDEYGLFVPTQYHGSTGSGWCVDRYSGKRYDEQDTNECTGSRYCRRNETEGRPCCAQYFEGSSSVFRLQCTKNGYFQTEQIMPFGDIHFCVNPATGFQAVDSPSPNCGACFKAVAERLEGKPLLGSSYPTCNDATGDFEPLQVSHDRYRYCVNPKTGAVESEKRSVDDKTPLPCEHQQ
jgi:nidogen (entactin)